MILKKRLLETPMHYVIRLFEDGNVSVSGLRGRGKDMLTANVVMRRGLPYISNVDYGGNFIPLDMACLNCRNDYRDFLTGNIKPFEWSYPDDVDVYISDAGVYFPSQYCGQLNNQYPYIPCTMAISRHLGFNIHTNCQRQNRVWDKVREQSDSYLVCDWICKPLLWLTRGKLVLQKVTVYSNADSAQAFAPEFPLSRPLLNPDRQQRYDLAMAQYFISHGYIKSFYLFYVNHSKYDTRRFKEMLANA